MTILVLKLPEVKVKTVNRPTKCPACGYDILQRWGGRKRTIRDPYVRRVEVYRYRCNRCRHTFRHYPEGIDQCQQSQRFRKLVAMCWGMGMSHRNVERMSGAFGLRVSHITSWRDVQAYADQIRHKRGQKKLRVLGIDGAYVLKKEKVSPVLVAVDMGSGQILEIGYVDEKDPRAVRRWIEPIVKKLGVSVIVTDDLNTYRQVAEKLDLEHQVCQFHVRRWVNRALKGLKEKLPPEWLWVLEEIKTLLADLPVEGSRRLFELWKQIPERRAAPDQSLSPLGELRYLLIRLSEH